MKPIQLGLLGIGTVGAGVFNVLTRNASEIARRAGRQICIHTVADLDTARANQIVQGRAHVTTDAYSVINHPEIDIVIELIGGDTIAKTLALAAIKAGKHLVTANKALLAKHGNEIFAAAGERGVIVAFEAAVAGGIPIIKALREGLTANRILWIAGIINGTSNFILSTMREQGLPFAEVLREAQKRGYAEADPSFDIEGVDAAHKLSLMSALAFGTPVHFSKVHIEGISALAKDDITHAEQLGYRIKLLGITRRTDKGIELRVHPTLIPSRCLLANVEGVMNGILVQADAVGPTLYYGAGAGSEPTASAVIADVVDITRLNATTSLQRVPFLAFQADQLSTAAILDMAETVSNYYLRIPVKDQPGVLAAVSGILAEQNISIGAMIQKEPLVGTEQVDIVILTHKAIEGHINTALQRIRALPTVMGDVVRLRMEELA